METYSLIATCLMGLESVVARELNRLEIDAKPSATQTGRVLFSGDFDTMIRANLHLRTAGKILIELERIPNGDDFEAIFQGVRQIDWPGWMPRDAAILVEARTQRSAITSTPALQRTVKKAIVEQLLGAYGGTTLPETGPAYTVEISLDADIASITLDTTGRGLHRRGYRRMNVAVPLRETLAAALVALSVWKPDRPLVDPFCGSGTIPIEAAMFGRNIAPGLKRSFAAEAWPMGDTSRWHEARGAARAAIRPALTEKIIGSDIDGEAVRHAEFHARQAGVADDIIFRTADFCDLFDEREYGCLITNPPYGDRTENRETFRALYESIPGALSRLPTWSHYILTSWNDFQEIAGRAADRRRKLYNGRLETTYFQFLGPRPPRKNGGETNPTSVTSPENTETPENVLATPPVEREIIPAFQTLDAADIRSIEAFGRCLANRMKHLSRYPKRGITSYRIYDRDLPEAPLVIELFEGEWLSIAEFERPDGRAAAHHRQWLDGLVAKAAEVLAIGPANLFLKRRAPQRGSHQYERIGTVSRTIEAHEGALRFLCNMTDYLDVGLFLDHRLTRDRIRREADGKRFLNLFCYTGSFTVAAAAGGATSSVSVDLSATYLDWACKNMTLNHLSEESRHQWIRRDALEFLAAIPPTGEGFRVPVRRSSRGSERDDSVMRSDFDLCVCDPPTFSNSKTTSNDWDVQHRHVELLRLLASRMVPGGVVYFSNNFRRFRFDAESLADLYTIRDISRQTVPEEYRNRRVHQCWRLVVKDFSPDSCYR